jgi:pyridinium-3,5-bisthiocarboxylic acid mononucleotide nickel chelatase
VRTLIFDPFAGISGDMTVAALLDLGLEAAWLRDFVAGLGIGDVDVSIEPVNRGGIAAPHVSFSYPPEKAHRHLRHVVEIIERCNAPERARQTAVAIFRRIAEAEAQIHGTTIEMVHFHEVGAMDAILDVMTVAAAVDELGFDEFRSRPVAVGSGWIDIQHGRYPVPAPATLRILEGLTLTGTDLAGECTTPTGAAILAVLTGGRDAPAEFVAGRTGFGAGTRDPQDRPNVLRLIEAVGSASSEPLWIVQADLDDMPAEYVAAAQDALLRAGALDVVFTAVTMKKGRLGTRAEVLVDAARLNVVEGALFLSTSTIGLRRWPVQRSVLDRRTEETSFRGQTIRWKHVRMPDGSSRSKPEYDDVVRAAAALGTTPWQLRALLDRPSAE